MKDLLRALFRRRRSDTYVLLIYEDGGQYSVGPMDRYTAEVFMATRLAPNPYYGGRRVASSRLVLQ